MHSRSGYARRNTSAGGEHPPGCGLPIGNLTSQLFSNVYLDLFDQYMVSLVGEGRYGRYVDDAYVVGSRPSELRGLVPLCFPGGVLPGGDPAVPLIRPVRSIQETEQPSRFYLSNHKNLE